MIIDKLNRAEKYYFLNDNFKKAFEFILNNDLKSFEPGKYVIDGENSFVILAEDSPNPEFINMLEAHRKYIDIQIPLVGSFGVTWKALEDCNNILQEYNEEKDATFFSDKPDFEIFLNENSFVILFPDDAHFAQPPTEYLKKAIVKVRV